MNKHVLGNKINIGCMFKCDKLTDASAQCLLRACLVLLSFILQHLSGESASLYLSGLSEGTSAKASSGLGSGIGMMYSLKEVTTS